MSAPPSGGWRSGFGPLIKQRITADESLLMFGSAWSGHADLSGCLINIILHSKCQTQNAQHENALAQHEDIIVTFYILSVRPALSHKSP